MWHHVRRIVHGVMGCQIDPLNNEWCVLSCLWDGQFKRSLAANRKVAHVVAAMGFLSL